MSDGAIDAAVAAQALINDGTASELATDSTPEEVEQLKREIGEMAEVVARHESESTALARTCLLVIAVALSLCSRRCGLGCTNVFVVKGHACACVLLGVLSSGVTLGCGSDCVLM